MGGGAGDGGIDGKLGGEPGEGGGGGEQSSPFPGSQIRWWKYSRDSQGLKDESAFRANFASHIALDWPFNE